MELFLNPSRFTNFGRKFLNNRMVLNIKNKKSLFLFTVILLLMNVVLIYLLKYNYQGVSLSEFDLSFPGNLLNLFVPIFLIFLLISVKTRNAAFFNKYTRLFFYLALLSLVFPLTSFVTRSLNLVGESPYILSQPFRRVFMGGLFSLSYLLLMFASAIAWLGLFKSEILIQLKAITRTLIYGVFLLLFSFAYLSLFSSSPNQLLGDAKSNLAVVLGAAVWSGNRPSDIHKSRLNKAAQLYFDKQVTKILLTGGNAPGEKSEAMIGYEYLIAKGVPARDLLMEEKTSSTTEQIRYIKKNIIRSGKIKNVVVVSSSFHLPRINEIRKFYKLNFKLASAEFKLSPTKQIYYKLREGFALHFFWLFGI